MQAYRLTLTPQTAFGTPLVGYTWFGHRSFATDRLRLLKPSDLGANTAIKSLPAVSALSLAELAQAANRYHLRRVEREAELLENRRLIAADWLRNTRNLLEQLKPALDSGRILPLRLGRNGGAENKTLEKYAHIKIMGKKGPPLPLRNTAPPSGWSVITRMPTATSCPSAGRCLKSILTAIIPPCNAGPTRKRRRPAAGKTQPHQRQTEKRKTQPALAPTARRNLKTGANVPRRRQNLASPQSQEKT